MGDGIYLGLEGNGEYIKQKDVGRGKTSCIEIRTQAIVRQPFGCRISYRATPAINIVTFSSFHYTVSKEQP
jgi:hypothetical protein